MDYPQCVGCGGKTIEMRWWRENNRNGDFKGLFTWSGGPRSSGVGFPGEKALILSQHELGNGYFS